MRRAVSRKTESTHRVTERVYAQCPDQQATRDRSKNGAKREESGRWKPEGLPLARTTMATDGGREGSEGNGQETKKCRFGHFTLRSWASLAAVRALRAAFAGRHYCLRRQERFQIR